ncbi:MAG: TatD family hydrolase, partial [Anaerolineales bacterium]|nr:TatD family hydrolase [Anaerolineales bacterium]
AVDLAEATPGVYAAVGVHPHEAESWSAGSADELRSLAASPAVVAIGEIGLDYYRDLSPRAAQRKALRAQLSLAAELGLPVIVHNRESTEDLLDELTHWADELPDELATRPGVLHAFSADRKAAEIATRHGFFLGVAGPITYPNADDRRRITAGLPAERLLVETDAPYMAPQAERGKRNEPAFVRFVAEALAEVKSTSLDKVADRTTANASNLFGWSHGTTNGNIL